MTARLTAATATARRGWSRVDWRDDRGQAGGMESVPLGMLVFVVGTLMITNLWAVIDTRMALNAAAREYVHAMAEAANGPEAERVGPEAAAATIEAWGRDPKQLVTRSVGYTDGNGRTTVWQRCARITVTVSYDLSLINLPFIGATWGPQPIGVRATRSELVDPFRSSAETLGAC